MITFPSAVCCRIVTEANPVAASLTGCDATGLSLGRHLLLNCARAVAGPVLVGLPSL